jgi:hypothetical protein
MYRQPPERRWVSGLAMAVVVVGCLGAVLYPAFHGEDPPAGTGGEPTPPSVATPADHRNGSWASLYRALDAHATALVRGDADGWLAVVDPANADLTKLYRQRFANLRALGITSWSHHPVLTPHDLGDGRVRADVSIAFCFEGATCPPREPAAAGGVPDLWRSLVMVQRDGAWLIVEEQVRGTGPRQDPPWMSEDLTVAKGRRVTVAAGPQNGNRIAEVVAAGDRAAAVVDRVAAAVGTAVPGYRVFLADDGDWSRWYGGDLPAWSAGYATQPGPRVMDVVVHLGPDLVVEELLRHEFGHVATVSDAPPAHDRQWLAEGIAEYIARGADRTASLEVVATLAPKPATIVAQPLAADASQEAADAFYAVAHLAVGCLVQREGEANTFRFVRSVLQGAEYEPAARTAFGTSFDGLDKACTAQLARGE